MILDIIGRYPTDYVTIIGRSGPVSPKQRASGIMERFYLWRWCYPLYLEIFVYAGELYIHRSEKIYGKCVFMELINFGFLD